MTTFDRNTQSINKITNTLWKWLSITAPSVLDTKEFDYTTVPWITGYQTGRLPARPFGTIFLRTSMKMMTQQNTTTIWDEELGKFKEITQTPMVTEAEISVFGKNATDILMTLAPTIGTQEVQDLFYHNGIRYNSHTAVQSNPKLENDKYEDRATLTIKIFTIFENTNLIDRIVQVSVFGTVDDVPILPQTIKIK